MGCWHGVGGCGPSYGPPRRRRYEPSAWFDELDWPALPRQERGRVLDREAATGLAARLADLRDELRQIEAELDRLERNDPATERATHDQAAGGR